MRVLSRIHPDLLQILDNFSTWFFSQDYASLEAQRRDDFKKGLSYIECTDAEYLKRALPTPDRFGFPRDAWGADMLMMSPEKLPKNFHSVLKKLDDDLITFLGARNNALKMYYPPKGFIGWHNNSNAHGYNIIMTFSKTGDGAFYHYDLDTKEINTIKDKPGWTAKAGYFGKFSEKDKIFWHSARTDCDRLTLSYVIYDKNIWENMIEEIESC
jgi:hypothetical protein